MKFIIDNNNTIPLMKPRKDWCVASNYEEYLDLEHTMFKFQRLSDYDPSLGMERTDHTYVDMKVTFIRDRSGSDEYVRAYITFMLNVPSGDHDNWKGQINVTVEEAVRICFEEMK